MGSSNLQDIESERAFVGCLVAGDGEAFETCPASAEHFLDPVAAAIFRAAVDLRAEQSPVSGPTVLHRLGLKRIEELGGASLVRETCNFPSPSQAEYFFQAIDGKLTLRRGHTLGRWAVAEAEGTNDPAGYALELRQKSVGVEAMSECANGLQTALEAFEGKLRRIESGKPEHGLQTRLSAWNKLFGGVLDGQMYGVAGRPGTGKTALMEQLVCDFLAAEMPVSVFERDMSPQKLVERMACRLVKVPYWALARGIIGAPEVVSLRRGIDVLGAMPLIIHNPENLTPERMCSIARRDIRLHGSRCIFLDHIQTFGTGRDIREKLTSASLQIRDMVNTTGIPAVILAHINRAGSKGRPTPEDIKEFDQLLGDVDAMLMLWSVKDRADLAAGELLEVNFYASKNRDAGVMEDVMLFKGDTMEFVTKAK